MSRLVPIPESQWDGGSRWRILYNAREQKAIKATQEAEEAHNALHEAILGHEEEPMDEETRKLFDRVADLEAHAEELWREAQDDDYNDL